MALSPIGSFLGIETSLFTATLHLHHQADFRYPCEVQGPEWPFDNGGFTGGKRLLHFDDEMINFKP